MKKKDLISFAIAIALVLVATMAAVVLIMTENNAAKNETASTELSTEALIETTVAETSSEASAEEIDDELIAEKEFKESEAADDQWMSDYRYILDNITAEEYPKAALIYVDDDEVPEMLLMGDENRLYTWHDGDTDFIDIDMHSFVFFEKGNLLTTADKSYRIKSGEFNETFDTIEENDEARVLGTYEFEELKDMLKSGTVSANEIERKEIPEEEESVEEEKKGKFDAEDDEIHSYEFVIGDYSWTQAYESVQQEGEKKYLARITSVEEYRYISELIKTSNLQNYQFWIGATREKDSSVYHWINNDGEISKKPVSKTGIYEGAWANGEPGLKSKGDNGEEVVDDCIMMYYDLENDVFKWKDAANRILSGTPSLAGKIGYIIETENDED